MTQNPDILQASACYSNLKIKVLSAPDEYNFTQPSACLQLLEPYDLRRRFQDIMMILLMLCIILAGAPHLIHTEAVNGASKSNKR